MENHDYRWRQTHAGHQVCAPRGAALEARKVMEGGATTPSIITTMPSFHFVLETNDLMEIDENI